MKAAKMLTEAEEEARVASMSEEEKRQVREHAKGWAGTCYWCKYSRRYCEVINLGVLCSKKKTHRKVPFDGHCEKYEDWIE
jgi:hypothetical protein